jgi:hypothetical protein
LAITVPLASILNVWKDDAYTLHTTSSGLAYAFKQSIQFEQNAPFYFLLVVIWRQVDQAATWARLLSVLCGAGVLAMIPALVRRYIPGVPALWVSLATALNPTLIWAALEIRMYSLAILLASALSLVLFDGFLRVPYVKRAVYLYSVLCLIAVYTEFYLVFVIIAHGVAILVYRRDAIARFAACVSLPILALLPIVRLIHGQVSNVTGQFVPPTLFDALHILARSTAQFIVPFVDVRGRLFIYVIVIAALIPLIVALIRSRQRGASLIMPTIFCTGFLLFLIVPYGAGVWLGSRHSSPLLVPAMLSFFTAFTFVREPSRMKIGVFWVCVILSIQCLALFKTYQSLAKEGDWLRVVDFIQHHELPHEPIFIFEAESALPYEYYYRGPNRVVPIPRPINFKHYDLRDFQVHTVQEVARSFNGVPSGGREWLITAGDCEARSIHYGCDVLEQYVSKCCRVTLSRTFYKARVRLLERSATQTTTRQLRRGAGV